MAILVLKWPTWLIFFKHGIGVRRVVKLNLLGALRYVANYIHNYTQECLGGKTITLHTEGVLHVSFGHYFIFKWYLIILVNW